MRRYPGQKNDEVVFCFVGGDFGPDWAAFSALPLETKRLDEETYDRTTNTYPVFIEGWEYEKLQEQERLRVQPQGDTTTGVDISRRSPA